MLIDLHLHTTRYSCGCSVLDPGDLVARLQERGLDGGVITEHNHVWGEEELRELKEDCGAEGLFLVSGQEVETDLGHLLVFGYDENIEYMVSGIKLAQAVREHGGAVVWAHPLRFGPWNRKSDREIVHVARKMDGWEAWTPSHSAAENRRAWGLARKYGLTATGSSDAHTASRVGACLTRFSRRLETLAHLVLALKEGACRPEPGDLAYQIEEK